MNHSFDTEHAAKYGVVEAVLIQNFMFWIAHNKANNRHFYDGRTWTYNSIAAFAELFPYLSGPQIRRSLDKLEAAGVIVTGNYNDRATDRSKWYAFTDECNFVNDQIHLPKSANGLAGKGKSLVNADGKQQKVNADGARGSRLSPEWVLPKTWGEWSLANCPGWTAEHVRLVADKFRDHWISVSGSKGAKADWLATWRNWCRNEPGPKKEGAAGAAWFATESGIIAKGAELGMTPHPGELTIDFKRRITARLDGAEPAGPSRLPQPFIPLPDGDDPDPPDAGGSGPKKFDAGALKALLAAGPQPKTDKPQKGSTP